MTEERANLKARKRNELSVYAHFGGSFVYQLVERMNRCLFPCRAVSACRKKIPFLSDVSLKIFPVFLTKNLGIASLFLKVQEANQSAVNFYRAHGFSVVGRGAFRVGATDYAALVMGLRLLRRPSFKEL